MKSNTAWKSRTSVLTAAEESGGDEGEEGGEDEGESGKVDDDDERDAAKEESWDADRDPRKERSCNCLIALRTTGRGRKIGEAGEEGE